jgi:hypothetical protein
LAESKIVIILMAEPIWYVKTSTNFQATQLYAAGPGCHAAPDHCCPVK